MKTYNCTQCNKEFERFPSTVRNEKRVFCGKECQGRYQRIEFLGRSNPNYKDGNWIQGTACECGKLKDHRAKQCAKCAKKSFPKATLRHRGSNDKIRKMILGEKLMPYVCAICERGPEWCGKPLTIQLDHIDGNHLNNHISNLRFLCPNCHSQTSTFGTRNHKRHA